MNPSERHRVLTRIFIETCELGGEERRTALERLCLGHPDLRAELELLLSIHDSSSRAASGPSGV